MAVDPAMTDGMLGTFRNMYKECVDKEARGPAFDRMKAALDRMEGLANEHSDFMAFQGQLMQENLMGDFSVAYGEVLADMAKPQGGGATGGYDDKALLEQTLNALRDAIKRVDEGVEQQRQEVRKHNPEGSEKLKTLLAMVDKDAQKLEPIKKAIQELVDFGSTCENLPTFLRLQIEKGLDKATEGSVVTREVYTEDVELNEIYQLSPYHISRSKEILEKYLQLEKNSVFGVPEAIDVEMENLRIEHKYAPDIEKWNKIKYDWKSIIDLLAYWAAAHCPRAPYVDPWVMLPKEARPPAIESMKNTAPGRIREKIRIFKENFGMDFKDIFTHESFKFEVQDHQIYYSQEYMLHLINVVYPQCKPNQFLSQDIIDKDEALYKEDRYVDPEPIGSVVNYIKWFENKYGAGSWEKFGQEKYEKRATKAAKWNLDEFLKQLNFQ